MTLPDLPAAEALTIEYFKAAIDNVIADIKDIREQLTGARDTVRNPDGTVDLAKSYPGWPETGGRTVTDLLGAIGAKATVPGCSDTKDAAPVAPAAPEAPEDPVVAPPAPEAPVAPVVEVAAPAAPVAPAVDSTPVAGQ